MSDIIRAIELIEIFMDGVDDFDEYVDDLKTKSAVERQLGIIGEAVNNFRKIELEFQLTNTRDIIGFRNRIIHNYDEVDETLVWAIIHNHLPFLKEEAEEGLSR
ncbi:DUF86 domain-containing protein [Pleurocapsa sp. PCC 7319]|uniref:HepT-like ribonuclease domain-containing protein n=1 Tax=Pleurocapsa sp. PCC 7319 TaxID=118161 RepID=UPI00192A73C8|nr:HepT-like ribonuclease domain-containing protein [Pleurocapsa sp. PCC 7319]